MFKAQAPGRVGIIGNPSDGYGGAVVSCTIRNRATATIESADSLIVTTGNGDKIFNRAEDFVLRSDYYDIFRAVFAYFKLYSLKARIVLSTTIPKEAGLAGSTVALSAILMVILAYINKKYDQCYIAELNRFIEYNYLKCQCGYQDAYMTIFGGLKYLDFHGKEKYRELDEEPYAYVEKLNTNYKKLPFIIAHTGVKRNSGQYHLPIRRRWLNGEEKVVEAYKKISALASEGKEALLSGNWHRLAWLMNENHHIQESLAFCGEDNNRLIKTALNNGALAAKLAGAGGGGTIIALTIEPEKTKKALENVGVKQFIDLAPDDGGSIVSNI